MSRRIADRGDVYSINPNPSLGLEMENRHPFVIVSPKEINRLGVAITVAVMSGGAWAKDMGLTVPITGHQTAGVAVCNMLRSFDLQARRAEYIETLDSYTVNEIVSRVLSIIDPLSD